MNLVQKVRQFLEESAHNTAIEEKIDYLLVNSTNEFLVEYSDLNENARYFLTNFSGSTGDALISKKDLFLFVDGRYHEQAALEADKSVVNVVKMKLHKTFTNYLAQKIKPNSTLAIVAKKCSQGRYEILKGALDNKNVQIKLLDFDPVMSCRLGESEGFKTTAKPLEIEQLDIKLTGMSADEKFKKIAATIKKNEAIITTNLEEVSYLCNLRNFSKNYTSQIEAKCLIMKDSAILFTDSRINKFSEKFNIQKLSDFEKYISNLEKIDKFYVDKLTINAYDYKILGEKAYSLKDNLIKKMKSIKTDAEIEHFKKCFERADKALLGVREFIENNENLSEFDITKKLEEEFYKNGAKSLSFKSIVAKDKNSALAHYSKNSKDEILKEGSLVLIDCGAYFEGGLATDCTRVFVKGNPLKLQKTIYTTVLKAFLAAFNKKITPKTSGFIIDKTARKLLSEIAPKGFVFSHSLGHGLGINVHEMPPHLGLSIAAKTILEPNMCFTIEPGLYKKSFGGVRLENSCYLAKTGDKIEIKSFSNMCFEKRLIDFDLLTKKEQKWLESFELR